MTELLRTPVTIVLFFLILGTLVVIHELGHFITARLAGVRVLEFGIGFPPRAKVLRAKGETLYTLNWLPIGGFVKLEGEDGDDTDDPRSFVNSPFMTKMVILVAGVLMNLVTAFLIFFFIAMLATPLVGLKVPIVEPDSPAAAAGLVTGDTIVAIDGRRFEFEGRPPDILGQLRANAGNTITLDLVREDGSREAVQATLRTEEEIRDPDGTGPLLGKGALGLRPLDNQGWALDFLDDRATHDPLTATARAGDQTMMWFGLILGGLGDLVRGFVDDPTAPPPVAGPIGIATQIGDVFWTAGPIMTLYVAGILSANLALVNALPFPPLDGGRMLMIALKRMFGRRISVQAERVTYFVGFAFLMAFLIWVTAFDVFGRGPS